jgi:hypothetical protein
MLKLTIPSPGSIMATPSNTELTKEPTCLSPPGSSTTLPSNEEVLGSFAFFPKLPIELRLKIWRYTFPRGRYVDLDDYDGFPIYSSIQTNGQLEKEPWLPITLSVNKESRQETLTHYIIVFLRGISPDQRMPLCYNPSLDAAFMDKITPWQGRTFGSFFQLESEAPETFTGTKVLRVYHWLDALYQIIYSFKRNLAGRLEISYGRDREGYSTDAIFRFTGLEELRLVLPGWAKEDYQGVLRLAETFKEQMIEFLEENAEVWGGNVPVVTFEEWGQLEKL